VEILLNNKVGINNFVRRQTKNSGKTYTSLKYEYIAEYANDKINEGNYRRGYREGVIIVDINDKIIEKFTCPFVKIDKETKIIAEVTRRRKKEEPYIRIKALNGKNLSIGKVELILYRHDVLMETKENSTNFDWELISFHGIPANMKNMPMGPITMMRNQLKLKGGTKGYYTSEEWAESVNFWQKYAIKETKNNNEDK